MAEENKETTPYPLGDRGPSGVNPSQSSPTSGDNVGNKSSCVRASPIHSLMGRPLFVVWMPNTLGIPRLLAGIV